MKEKRLPHSLLVRTLFRGMLIQSAWNYENFQGIGFAFACIPFLKRLSVEEPFLRECLQRHLKVFNTNPYMAGLVVGGTLRLEEERFNGVLLPEQVESLKRGLMGALGALGDSFVWGSLRPLAALLAVMVSVVFENVAPLVFLLAYNGITLWLRWAGIRNGYAYGIQVLNYLKKINLQKKIHWMGGMILFLSGAFLSLWGMQTASGGEISFLKGVGVPLFLIAAAWYAEAKRVPLPLQVFSLLAVSQILSFMGWSPFLMD